MHTGSFSRALLALAPLALFGCSSRAPEDAARTSAPVIGTPHHAIALAVQVAYTSAPWMALRPIPLEALPTNVVENILPFVPPMFEPGDRASAFTMLVPAVGPNGLVFVLERDGVPLHEGGPTRQVVFFDAAGAAIAEALGSANALTEWNEVSGITTTPLE
jgi:hypothetical protein